MVSESDYLSVIRMRQSIINGIVLKNTTLSRLTYVIRTGPHMLTYNGDTLTHTCVLVGKVNAIGYVHFGFVFSCSMPQRALETEYLP